MVKRYSHIADLIEETTQDKEYADSIREKTAGRRLAKLLVGLRLSKNKTQEELAKAMGCEQSHISRMENGPDDSFRFTEVAKYTRALGLHMKVFFDDPQTPRAQRVKAHVFVIKKLLDELADMAGDDPELRQKIREFYGEVLINFLLQFGDSCQKLGGVLDIMDTVLNNDEAPAQKPQAEPAKNEEAVPV